MTNAKGMCKHLITAQFAAVLLGVAPTAIADPRAEPFELWAGYEEWALPANESMGMASVGVRKQVTPNIKLGVDAYTAIKGERGGFITLGVGGEYEFRLAECCSIEAGLFVGAGGGKGGYQLAGGGLMLRENIGFKYRMGALGNLSLGWSQVDFPENGNISSNQAYIAYSLPYEGLFEPGYRSGDAGSFGLGTSAYLSKRHQFSVLARQAYVASDARKDDGTLQEDLSMLGVEWRTFLTPNTFVKLETVGAMGGNSAGYMHILAGGGLQYPLSERLVANVALAVGGGGGGGVDAGGGLLVNTSLGLQYSLSKSWFVDVSADYLVATSASFESRGAVIRAGYQFGADNESSGHSNVNQMWHSHPLRFRFVDQHYFEDADNWRSRPDQNVGNLGIQADYFLGPNWFLTGQGLSAYTGDAGSYMAGLIGMGVRKELGNTLFVEAEGLVGAAGGGGLNVGSGLVYQSNLGLGVNLSRSLSVMGTVGLMKAANGDFAAKVAGISIGYQFGMFTPRN